MKYLCIAWMLLWTTSSSAQIIYQGTLGTAPIELVAMVYSSGDTKAYYVYSRFDTPIAINGTIENGILSLYEEDENGNNAAVLTFKNFTTNNVQVEGTWTSMINQKQLRIVLQKKYDMDDHQTWTDREMLQEASTNDFYFRLMVSKREGSEKYVSGVKVFKKKTDELLQHIRVDCQWQGMHNLQTGDYNFDGVRDFSIFESSYAGPNTSSLYFLYDPASKKFIDSGFEGTSLNFDTESKTISERNSCCAGSKQIIAAYKVVNNKMVLIEKHCLSWNEDKEEFVESTCE